jgi:hypothetical protein
MTNDKTPLKNARNGIRKASQEVREDAERLGVATSARDFLMREAHADGVRCERSRNGLA